MKKIYLLLMVFAVVLSSCEEETEGISQVTVFPVLTMNGEEYMSVARGETFNDPGATAKEGETDLEVKVSGEVNVNEPGLYEIVYSATNQDGFEGTISRMVAVLPAAPTTADDILGSYFYVAAPDAIANVTKLAPGFYRVSNIWSSATTIAAYLITSDGKDILMPLQNTPFGRLQGEGTLSADGKLDYVVDLLDQNNLIDVPRHWMRVK